MSEENKKTKDEESKETLDTHTKDVKTKSENKPAEDTKSKGKADTQKSEDVSKEKFDAVANNLSKKDKELSEMKKQIDLMQNREMVKDLLLEADVPESIRSKLKANIANLTPDNFESTKEMYIEIYNAGKESYKKDQLDTLSDTPSKTKDATIKDKIDSATSADDLEAMWNNRN